MAGRACGLSQRLGRWSRCQCSAKAGAILSSVASGDCPADVGAVLMQSVTALARIIEVDELERRIAALEAV